MNGPDICDTIRRLHNSQEHLDEWVIDGLLNLRISQAEYDLIRDYADELGHPCYRSEELWLGSAITQTDYNSVRSLIHRLGLTETDHLYDLGSGYGRLPLYAGITTPARITGIELLPQRVEQAAACKERLRLDGVSFLTGNVTSLDYSDGTVFYLFNPFSNLTLQRVVDQIKEIALTKTIRVASLGDSNYVLQTQPWLKLVEEVKGWYGHTFIYQSRVSGQKEDGPLPKKPWHRFRNRF